MPNRDASVKVTLVFYHNCYPYTVTIRSHIIIHDIWYHVVIMFRVITVIKLMAGLVWQYESYILQYAMVVLFTRPHYVFILFLFNCPQHCSFIALQFHYHFTLAKSKRAMPAILTFCTFNSLLFWLEASPHCLVGKVKFQFNEWSG